MIDPATDASTDATTDPPTDAATDAALGPGSIPSLTRAQARRVDEIAIGTHGMSGLVLMENAGRDCADILMEQTDGPVAICCGKGNNAGDGFVMARHLDNAGIEAAVLMTASPGDLSPDARANYDLLAHCDVAIVESVAEWHRPVAAAAWLVDALLGTGADGEPRSPLDAVIALMNGSNTPIMAVDVPSGLDADTGEQSASCVQASLTATFVAPKVGFASKTAAGCLGLVETVDIGVPRSIIDAAIRA